jgi:hypothetical protein
MIRCHKCKRNKFDFLFAKNNGKFKIPAWKGRLVVCRLCVAINVLKSDYVVRYNKLVKVENRFLMAIKNYFKV